MAGTNIPGVGTISYNGITFPNTTETLGIDIKPVYDRANRTVIYNQYSLRVKSKFSSGVTGALQASQMESLRTALTLPGQTLTITGKGFGNLTINGANPDVKWGPTPRMLSWRTIGGNIAAEIVWSVDFCITDCAAATTYGILALNYTMDYDVDKSGYTTRNYTGYIEISQSRLGGGRRLADVADNYLERVIPPVPPGFQRTSTHRSVDEAKNTLNFSVTDQELPSPFPEGIVSCQASQTNANESPMKFHLWTGTINASYEVARGYSRSIALAHFYELCYDRAYEAIRTSPINFGGNGNLGAGGIGFGRAVVIPLNVSMTEPEIHGRQAASFSFSYRVATPVMVWLSEGLWRAVPGADFRRWAVSLARVGVTSPTGYAGMRLRPADDAIIDICGGQNQSILRTGSARPPIGTNSTNTPGSPSLEGSRLLQTMTSNLTPYNSWMSYTCSMSIEPIHQVAVHFPLAQARQSVLTGGSGSRPGGSPANAGQTGLSAPRQNYAPIIQRRAGTVYYVRLRGSAMRAGFSVTPPTLVRVGGARAVEVTDGDAGEGLTAWTSGQAGVTIFNAAWNFRYVLESTPDGNIYLPSNPNYSTQELRA